LFIVSIEKIAEASILAYFLYQGHKFDEELLDGVDILRATVEERT
jgi:hypothetical protein